MALLLEAERQGLMNGDYVFFLMQHFEVSEGKQINSWPYIQPYRQQRRLHSKERQTSLTLFENITG